MLSEEILSSNLFVKLPFSTSSNRFFSLILMIFCSILFLDTSKKFEFSKKNKNLFWNFNGNMSKVSDFTGMERTALYRKIKSLNIIIKS